MSDIERLRDMLRRDQEELLRRDYEDLIRQDYEDLIYQDMLDMEQKATRPKVFSAEEMPDQF